MIRPVSLVTVSSPELVSVPQVDWGSVEGSLVPALVHDASPGVLESSVLEMSELSGAVVLGLCLSEVVAQPFLQGSIIILGFSPKLLTY